MREIPEIQEVMTSTPKTVDFDQPVREARQLMNDASIRHLPVTRGKQVVGMLSERDILTAEAMEKELGETISVSDLCELDAYVVEPRERLDSVLSEMADRGIGSVVVVDSGNVVGIFTTIDACKGYADLLRSHSIQD